MTRETYYKEGGGKYWELNPGSIDIDDFSSFGPQKIHSDDMTLVATMPVEEGETFAFGSGNGNYSGDVAPAYLWLDARINTDSDSDGVGDEFDGQYMLSVVNAAHNRVTGGQIARGELSSVRRGDPTDENYGYGEWGVPLSRKTLMNGNDEIPPGQGYKVGLFIKTKNGTKDFNLGDTRGRGEGHRGHPVE